jgi:hypothetical protein
VLFDLIRAVPVAVLVGLVPGYFWARLLAATDDPAERLAYAFALSTTLVPAVALILSSILGTGVTTIVSIVSVAIVFLAGLAARLFFGPAKGPEGPISPLPPTPDAATLAPLCLGLLLALGTFFGFLGGWAMIPVVVLVVVSGVLYWISLRRRDAQPEEQREEASPGLVYGLLSAALVLALARGYFGPTFNGWPFPRGVDRYEHAIMTTMMAEGGSTESFMLYPPGFHALSAMISNLSGLEPMALFPALGPSLLALTSLASYALAARLWGRMAGVAAAFLTGPVLGGAYLHFVEARYPNFVGEQVIMIVAIAALIMMYANPTARTGILLAVLGSSAVFYHQIAGYVMAVLLAVTSLFFLPYLLLRHRRTGLALLGSLAGLFVLAVAFAWDTYDLPSLVAGLFGDSAETGRGGEAVAMAIGTKPANHPTYLLVTITAPVLWLGLFGAMTFLPRRTNANISSRLAHLTLIIWAALLFVGSQTSYSGFPDRFDRDLGVPLALLAAPILLVLLRASPRLAPSRAALALMLAAALLSAGLLVVQTTRNLEEAAGPSERPRDRPAPAEVAAAGTWLEENNAGGSIVATPYLDYVPSRGMLAMGGYTEMQSYDFARIQRARDLPPFGEGPLLEALWVLKHPTGEKTRRIMAEYDVRYVIFHKRYPGISWLPYSQREDRYAVAYQNPSVIIFEPRDA